MNNRITYGFLALSLVFTLPCFGKEVRLSALFTHWHDGFDPPRIRLIRHASQVSEWIIKPQANTRVSISESVDIQKGDSLYFTITSKYGNQNGAFIQEGHLGPFPSPENLEALRLELTPILVTPKQDGPWFIGELLFKEVLKKKRVIN
jgi:hypothetical protein